MDKGIDDWLEGAYEDRWPSDDEMDEYDRRLPEPPQTDDERERIAEDWDRFGDEQDAMS